MAARVAWMLAASAARSASASPESAGSADALRDLAGLAPGSLLGGLSWGTGVSWSAAGSAPVGSFSRRVTNPIGHRRGSGIREAQPRVVRKVTTLGVHE